MFVWSLFVKFFWLMFGHALADYALQTDFIAKGKNRHTPIPGIPWYYVMGAHSIIHGGMVGLFTGSLFLALCETAIHFYVDCMKCDGRTTMHQDQSIHVLCELPLP